MKHFLALADETPASFRKLLDRAAHWKTAVKSGKVERILDANSARTSPLVLAMIFQKPSNRTRVSFELAMHHFGGKALYLSPQEIGLGKREATRDVAVVLGRYVNAIMARVFSHTDITELSRYAGVPVINGLSDLEHPCQGLADFQTILEHQGSVVTYVGDGNNVCHSLMLGAALLGMEFRWIGPKGYEPKIDTGARLFNDMSAVEGSNFVYTDVWVSMGDEAEADVRKKVFDPFRLDSKAMKFAPDAKILHCLPAHRGDEITDDVIDSPQSVVFDQAENRLYAQMAVLERALT